MISHNMADVRAVADTVAVLRLGRNNGVFDALETCPSEEIVAAITGASDNAVTAARPARRAVPPRAKRREVVTARRDLRWRRAADLQDERSRTTGTGSGGRVAAGAVRRVRGGDLGMLPVVAGLVVIWTVFQILNPVFLSSTNLVNLSFECVPVGVIALGIVCVLLVGQIDLSVGSVSGMSAAVTARAVRRPRAVGVAGGAGRGRDAGALIGWLYAQVFNRFGVPSFVITLAGLLAFLGAAALGAAAPRARSTCRSTPGW